MTIFQTSPYGTPTATNIFCAEVWSAFSLYRELPVSTTSSSSSSSSTASTVSSTQSQTRTSSSIPSQTSASTTSTSESNSSKAWIAGAVVGPVAGVAVIAGLAWFMFRRKQKETESEKSQEQIYTDLPQELYTAPQELPASNSELRHELDTYSYR
ncbi:uncharacterized protein N7482_000150 [Penicillium canariense]|uniref:Mid2 domain-containing protein n=1 Tax=Penicillium canariense TaxID=189055 RepID=A0A9W9LRR6_9EURO|nr:uncharacterized protein N7482_000150 [Penicillium canariense]KAJ5174273.1 hypothetical protein N7482_000150 [Penicillium canariense]